jgi:hypothetical protein
MGNLPRHARRTDPSGAYCERSGLSDPQTYYSVANRVLLTLRSRAARNNLIAALLKTRKKAPESPANPLAAGIVERGTTYHNCSSG